MLQKERSQQPLQLHLQYYLKYYLQQYLQQGPTANEFALGIVSGWTLQVAVQGQERVVVQDWEP